MLPALLLLLVPQSAAPQPHDPFPAPAGQHMLLSVLGRGFQVYRCTASAAGSAPAWTFLAPEARLFQNGKQIGTHDAGPSWHAADGSSVTGVVVSRAPSADLVSIPQLLLQAKSTSGQGVLAQVATIERTGTQGGTAPQTGCDTGHIDNIVKVPYQATYTFFGAD